MDNGMGKATYSQDYESCDKKPDPIFLSLVKRRLVIFKTLSQTEGNNKADKGDDKLFTCMAFE